MGNYKSDKRNTRFYGLKLATSTDADILNKLAFVGNVQGYLKDLIREDIAREGASVKRYTVDKLTPAASVKDSYSDGMDRETVLRFEAEPDLSWNQVEAKLAEVGIDVSGHSRDFGVLGAFRFNSPDDGPNYEVY